MIIHLRFLNVTKQKVRKNSSDNKFKNLWSGTYGLPRSLWLGDDGALRIRPVRELKSLRLNEVVKSNFVMSMIHLSN